jgi:hypothetical protein
MNINSIIQLADNFSKIVISQNTPGPSQQQLQAEYKKQQALFSARTIWNEIKVALDKEHKLHGETTVNVPFIGEVAPQRLKNIVSPFGLNPAGMAGEFVNKQTDVQINSAISNIDEFMQKNLTDADIKEIRNSYTVISFILKTGIIGHTKLSAETAAILNDKSQQFNAALNYLAQTNLELAKIRGYAQNEIKDITKLSAKKTKKKVDPKAKVRNRGTVVFPAESKNIKDKKDHFPINSESQARNALARSHQYSKVPSWYNGSLKSLQEAIRRKVHSKYPKIEISKQKKKSSLNELIEKYAYPGLSRARESRSELFYAKLADAINVLRNDSEYISNTLFGHSSNVPPHIDKSKETAEFLNCIESATYFLTKIIRESSPGGAWAKDYVKVDYYDR